MNNNTYFSRKQAEKSSTTLEPLRSERHCAAPECAESWGPIFPLHEVDENGACSCGNPGCDSPGKHPRIKDWPNQATTDPRQIHRWWSRWPQANIAGVTGKGSGKFAVDFDHPFAVDEFEEKYGGVSNTRTHSTGSGGVHAIYAYPEDAEIRNSARLLGDYIDVRGEGGYVLLPPSRTTRPYEVLEPGPIAEAPPALIQALTEPQSGRRATTVGKRPIDLYAGEIRERTRNQTLFFIALDFKDEGKDRDESLAELLEINDTRCSPALGFAEVEAIVKSAFRYPIRGKRTPPEVLEALDALKRSWWGAAWRGVGGKSERDILRVLIQFAERYGQLIASGVRVSLSYRDLALVAGCGRKTVERAVKRLRLRGWLRGDNGFRSGTEAGAFVLLARPTDDTQGIVGARGGSVAESVVTLSRLPEITPCFRWRGFVGKGCAGVLYVLEVFGEQSLEELAERLGFSRARDLRRLYLEPLAEMGLIEDRGGVYALPEQEVYAGRVDEIRSAPCGGGPRKVRSKDGQGRVVTRIVEVPPKSEKEREEEDRWQYEKDRRKRMENLRKYRQREGLAGGEADGTISELEVVPEPEPEPEVRDELADALAAYLERNPHRADELPGWLSVTLWAEEYTPTKPPPEEIARLLPLLVAA